MRWLAVFLVVVANACGGGSDAADSGIAVFAAASLTEAFTALGEAFEAEHPDTHVTFNFAGSSALATQLAEGADADVFAAADVANMDEVVEDGLVDGEPVVFAINRPEIVVEPGNPHGIATIDDLAARALVVLTCAPQVPCGQYAAAIFEGAGVDVVPDSYEANVKAVVAKVALGEADAAIGYATDVRAAGGDVDGVEIAPEVNVVAEYPMAVIADADHPARTFVDFVLSDAGRTILAEFGFESP